MKEAAITTAIAGVTGFLGWLFSKLQTRRERKKSDLQMIHESTANLVESIKILTQRNGELINELMEEQKKHLTLLKEKLEWQTEREEFIAEIEGLKKEVKALTKKINELINNKKS